jgi:hypothetical protein
LQHLSLDDACQYYPLRRPVNPTLRTLNVLEGLFDFYFVEPAKTAARKAALDEKLGRTTP